MVSCVFIGTERSPLRRLGLFLAAVLFALLGSATSVGAIPYDYDGASFKYDELVEVAQGSTAESRALAAPGVQLESIAAPDAPSFGNFYDSSASFVAPRPGAAPNLPIGFAPGAADTALANVGRVDHASIHLVDHGLISGSKGSTVARNGFRDAARPILESPLQTFDHVMARSGQSVKGFVGEINGQQVVIFVAKAPNGKIAAGDIVTSVVPSPQQIANWGIGS